MAVILRDKLQPILDDHGLDDIYADLDADSKELTLYTERDGNLVSIPGIRFSSLKPTLAEIAAATNLLTNWLASRAIRFSVWLDLKSRLDMAVKPYSKEGFYGYIRIG